MNSNHIEVSYCSERFRRPSNQLPLVNNFSFEDFEKVNDRPPLISTVFKNPDKLIKAYFGILRNASNMHGYLGGCGSIGNSLQPYPYAYGLLSETAQNEMPLSEFVNSFRGIGHITLLKLYPAFTPSWIPANICSYMFEVEAITGPSEKDELSYNRDGSYFVYYYGLITVEKDTKCGWKIKSIDYLPEDFLCAPEHGWIYSSAYIVTFVYKDWYQLIDTIDCTTQKGNFIYLYATGKNVKYRFDFVRITNGYDILLHENICDNDRWQETNILKVQDQGFKLSLLKFNL